MFGGEQSNEFDAQTRAAMVCERVCRHPATRRVRGILDLLRLKYGAIKENAPPGRGISGVHRIERPSSC